MYLTILYRMLHRRQSTFYIITVIMTTLYSSDGLRCKWSNENCGSDAQCCSGRCVKLHEGTNARCASSPMHFPCFFGYQCEDGLACGEMYNCCAPFWGVCSELKDCCDSVHVCREEDGFTYQRCLPPNGAPLLPGTTLLLIVIVHTHLVIHI